MPLIAMPPCALWYFRQLPQLPREMVQGGAAPMMMFFAFGVVMSVILGGYAYFIMIRRERRIGDKVLAPGRRTGGCAVVGVGGAQPFRTRDRVA